MKTSFFVPLQKVDDEQRMVWGYASTPDLDSQGDVVTLDAIKAALPDYMRFGNVREMHQPSAVGKAIAATVDEKGFYLGAHVVDDVAWKKVKAGVYNGFSIGGRVTKRNPAAAREIVGLTLAEVSLVDRPANPSAVFDVWKAASGGNEEMDLKELGEQLAAQNKATTDAISKLADVVGKLAEAKGAPNPKPAPDPAKKSDDSSSTARELELQAQLDTLQKRIEDNEAKEKLAVRKQVLDAACAAGKFKVADRKRWEKDYDENPSLVTRLLKDMAPVVPIGQRVGIGGDGDEQSATQKFEQLAKAKAREIVEMDKLDSGSALVRAYDIVARENPDLYKARTEESLRAASPHLVMGTGFMTGAPGIGA